MSEIDALSAAADARIAHDRHSARTTYGYGPGHADAIARLDRDQILVLGFVAQYARHHRSLLLGRCAHCKNNHPCLDGIGALIGLRLLGT